MKDNKEGKKGFVGFFKKDKQENSGSSSKKEPVLSSELGDTESITNFFSQDKMNTSQQDDLSELIRKLQTQKSGLDLLEFKKEDNNQKESQKIDNSKDLIPKDSNSGNIITEKPDTHSSLLPEENIQESSEIGSPNIVKETLMESDIKPVSELQKILGDIKKQKPQPKILEEQSYEFSLEEKPQITGFEPLSKPIKTAVLDVENDFFEDLTEDVSKSEKIEETDSTEINNNDNKTSSNIDRIFGRIKKAEEIINIKKEHHEEEINTKMPEKSILEPVKEQNLENNAEGNVIENDSGISPPNLIEKNTIIKKPVSELEAILGKIKNIESTEKIKETSEEINQNSETKNEDISDEISQEKYQFSAPLKEPVNEITIEKEEEIEYQADDNEDNKASSSQPDSEEKEINEPELADNLSEESETEISEDYSVTKETDTPPKKYTANRTKWSQAKPKEEDKTIQDEDENIKRKTISSAKKTRWSETDSEIDEEKVGIISAGDIDEEYSGLILAGGATFKIEEFTLKSIQKEIEPDEQKDTISKIEKIYSEHFPPIDLEKINQIDLSDKKEKKKSKLFDLFKESKRDKYEYNPSIHGPIVDLSFKEIEGVEEIELYPVNEPYAYVRIVYDKNTNEYIYNAIEPILNNAESKLLSEIEQRLFETLDVNTKDLTKEKAKEILKDSVNDIIADYGLKLGPAEREKIIYHINREFLGEGLIDPIMHDKYIEDISCDGLNTPIFVFHSNYESLQTNLFYNDSSVLDSFVTKLAQRAGKYISIAEPMLDATMTDGSRIQMTLGTEVTAHGSTFTIRKFKDEPITPTDLTEWGTFSPLSIAYIWLAVEAGKSCIFAGGTASGKTTSLNAISLFIPPLAKIVTLEDTRELKLPHQNWIPSVTRESFDKNGKGSIDMYELLRAALRQRPEYILVGEVRGAEAQTLFQAMSTGHVTYATMHADSVASVVHRIENPPLNVPRNMLSSLDLISVQVQVRIGGQRTRRNKQLIEILDIDPRTRELITNEVFKWNQATDEIRYSGKSYILEDIMESRGWDEARMVEELKRRQEILEWMRLKKLRNYKDVGKVLMSYYRDPEAIIKLVREDLYE